MAIEDIIRSIVREELARVDAVSSEYSSDSLPPRTSRRSFHEGCRSGAVDGAEKTGRTWSCSKASWHAARSTRPAAKTAPSLRLVPQQSDEALADSFIASAGFRKTRGVR